MHLTLRSLANVYKKEKKETTPERKRKERKANGNHKKLNGEKNPGLGWSNEIIKKKKKTPSKGCSAGLLNDMSKAARCICIDKNSILK